MKHWMVIIVVALSGCATVPIGLAGRIDGAIANYLEVADQIQIGDHKEEVLTLLLPSQHSVPVHSRRDKDSYTHADTLVEIYYMRSGRQPDGLTTDDEFTPYIFNDGILMGIGWKLLGGPGSRSERQTVITR